MAPAPRLRVGSETLDGHLRDNREVDQLRDVGHSTIDRVDDRSTRRAAFRKRSALAWDEHVAVEE